MAKKSQIYKAKRISNLVKTKKEINKNISEKKFKIVDARNKNRFLGLEKEPRPGIRSGSIKNSYSSFSSKYYEVPTFSLNVYLE